MTMAKPAPKLLMALPILLCSLLMLMYFHGLTFDPNQTSSRLVGKATPVISLPSLHTGNVFLNSESIKGPAIINIWAAWCGACRDEHAQLLRMVREEGVNVYGIDYQDDAETAKVWLKQNGDPYKWVMFDGAAAAGLKFDIFSLPQTYAIDANGIVRARHIGSLTPDVWYKMRDVIIVK